MLCITLRLRKPASFRERDTLDRDRDRDRDRDLDKLTLVSRLFAESDVSVALPQRLVEACVRITGLAGGAITLEYTSQERITVASTNHDAARLEDLQEVTREGPGWDAHHDFEAVCGDLVESPARWATLAAAAMQEVGPVWMCAAPIRAGSELIGVMTLHGPTMRQGLTTVVPDGATLQFLADVIGAAFYSAVDPQLEQRKSWTELSKVHQAGGMIASQLSLPMADALALPRAHAFSRGTSILSVAELVLDQTLRFNRRPRGEPAR